MSVFRQTMCRGNLHDFSYLTQRWEEEQQWASSLHWRLTRLVQVVMPVTIDGREP